MISISDLVSGLALFVAIFALWHSVRASRRQESSSTYLAHLAEIVQVESRLGELPDALRFHGLRKEELERVGVTPQEFAYLVNSFTLGKAWHKVLTPEATTPYGVDSYRFHMCESKEMRQVWPLVKRLLNPGPYVDRIDATIAQIEEKERNQTPA
jgi:hypothetical protein